MTLVPNKLGKAFSAHGRFQLMLKLYGAFGFGRATSHDIRLMFTTTLAHKITHGQLLTQTLTKR
jgi:hypothetical protein